MNNKIKPNTKVLVLSDEHYSYILKMAKDEGYETKFCPEKPVKGKKILYFENRKVLNNSGYERYGRFISEEILIDIPRESYVVHRSKHYEVLSEIETIEIIASALTCEQWRGYCLGNVMRHRLRAEKKDADKANEYEMIYHKYLGNCKDS